MIINQNCCQPSAKYNYSEEGGHVGNPKLARIGNLVLVEHRQEVERGKPFTQHPILLEVSCMHQMCKATYG
jgi:hypothetical protein